jgi:3-deoxy-7-phosphoheptulonate synthase
MWIRLTDDADLSALQGDLQGLGVWTQAQHAPGGARALWVLPHSAALDPDRARSLPGVAEVYQAPVAWPRVAAQAGEPLRIAGVALGGEAPPVLAAGPCAVESRAQAMEAAALAAEAGARLLRGGAFKPRSSPYSFRGHGPKALDWLREAADAHGLLVVSEVLGPEGLEPAAEAVDLIQIGSRNMQNFSLLADVGRAGKPVLLKRGNAASVEEWLLAGEHLLAAGAGGVVFCERGVRGFDPGTRNLLDLGAVALLRWVHRQPILVDPSHALGRRDLILPLARAALAAGAHGLLLEAHPNPGAARSDGPQALSAADLLELADAFAAPALVR